jgi:predicted porin
MNKKLIAAAIAAGLVAAAPAAQADVKIWGKAHVSLDSMDTDAATDSTSLHVQSNSSRLGVKVSEDLGGGLKALAAYEFSVGVSDNSAVSSNRNAYVGLAGGFGSIKLGRHDTPFKTVNRKVVELFGDQIGDLRNLTRPNSGGGNRWDERNQNMILYTTPKLGGSWKIMAQYTVEDGTPDTTQLVIGAMGKAGPVKIGVAYKQDDLGTGNGDESGLRVGAGMKFGAADIRLGYSQYTDQGNVSGQDSDIASVGVKFKVGGKGAIKAQYAARSNDNVTDGDATTIAVGYDHKLSKKTTIYAAYATTDNDANAQYNVDDAGHGGESGAAVPGADPSGISLGMIVKF